MYRTLAPIVCALLIVGTGCGLPAGGANRPDAWVSRLGGPAATSDLSHVEAAAARLARGSSRAFGRVLIAAHDQPGAWSWSNGSLVLTQKLLGSLSDDELAAVLAHELGHLELDARPHRHALASGAGGSSLEEAADDAGCVILARSGIDPTLMPFMLRRVAALEGDTKAGRSALQRAARLERRAGLPAADVAAPGVGDSR